MRGGAGEGHLGVDGRQAKRSEVEPSFMRAKKKLDSFRAEAADESPNVRPQLRCMCVLRGSLVLTASAPCPKPCAVSSARRASVNAPAQLSIVCCSMIVKRAYCCRIPRPWPRPCRRIRPLLPSRHLRCSRRFSPTRAQVPGWNAPIDRCHTDRICLRKTFQGK